MTYKELAEAISKLTEEQQNMDVLVNDTCFEELLPIKSLEPKPDELYADIVDPTQPILKIGNI